MPQSQQQVKWAHATIENPNADPAKKKFATEVVDQMNGRKFSELPKKAAAPKQPRYRGGRNG
jgi:hypothetical protein